MNKKGQALGNLQAMIVPIVGVAIVLVVGFLILAEGKDQIKTTNACGNTSDLYNSSGDCCYHVSGTCRTNMDTGNHTGYSLGYNGTTTTQSAMADIPTWLPIIIITVIGGILLGLVAMFKAR